MIHDLKKLYFRDIDSTMCETLEDLLEEAKNEGLTEITLTEVIPDTTNNDMVWCGFNDNVEEKIQCGKGKCIDYKSKSGRGKCSYKGKLYTHGEEHTFNINH